MFLGVPTRDPVPDSHFSSTVLASGRHNVQSVHVNDVAEPVHELAVPAGDERRQIPCRVPPDQLTTLPHPAHIPSGLHLRLDDVRHHGRPNFHVCERNGGGWSPKLQCVLPRPDIHGWPCCVHPLHVLPVICNPVRHDLWVLRQGYLEA